MESYNNLWEQFKSGYTKTEIDFFPLLLSMARSVTKDQHLAEDLVQDTLLSFLTSKPKIDIQNLPQYVYRSIKNRYINLSKASDRRILREDIFLSIQAIQNDNAEEMIKHQKQLLFVSLKLKEKEYQLLRMLFKLSLEEIADEMNISLKTVKNKKSLLLKKLKTIITAILFFVIIQFTNSI